MGGDAVSFPLPRAGTDATTRGIDDGVRRRLVSALVKLQRADECLDDEPELAGDLIRDALDYADIGPHDPVAEIYQNVLAHRGLAAAVAALANVSPIPMTMDVTLARCEPSVEAAAYFLTAETMTIVSGQTNATRMHVAAYRARRALVVELCCDDVVRGDDRLADLSARVEAFDGRLHVLRQPGIGTRLRATFATRG